MREPNRILLAVVSLALALLLFSVATAQGGVTIDPDLADRLETTTGAVSGIVVFDSPPVASQIRAIEQTGAAATALQALPFALVLANRSQFEAIAGQAGVRAIWNDSEQMLLDDVVVDEMGPGSPISESFWLTQVRADRAQEAGIDGGSGGQPVGVAVVDTGVDANHPDLGYDFENGLFKRPGRVIQNVHIEAANKFTADRVADLFAENQPNTDTDVGHGTAVAGVIAGGGDISGGVYKGVAPGARIIGLQAGTSLFLFESDILLAFDYVIRNRQRYNIRVVNNSWGSAGPADPDEPINLATRTMAELGIVVVFSAGNADVPDEGEPDPVFGDPRYPVNPHAKVPWTISAGASSPTRGLTFFSSRDFKQDPNLPDVPPGEYVDVIAPGQDVVTARATTGTTINTLNATNDQGQVLQPLLPYYTSLDGTSFSGPMVAGAAALLLDSEPYLTPLEVRQRLRDTAAPLLGYEDYQVGAGLLDVAAALGLERTQRRPRRPGGAAVHRQIGRGYSGGFILVAPGSATTDVNFDVFGGADRFDVTLTLESTAASTLDTTTQNYRITLIDPNDQIRRVENMPLLPTENATITFSFEPDEVVKGTWDLEILNFGPGVEYDDGYHFHRYELAAEVVYR